ncbi:Hypothetical_protein [Hexamita inflata]|uniref:Hypothetical_protein n=1 Tax=Hexamita inflata TaxID=28002 RepID=A0AA86V0Q9_9EUKA|nr:Hypothetical protein HINF_LOCUS59372 [Hexamita inflata]
MEQVSQSNQCIGMSTEITALAPNISYIYIFIWQFARFKMPNLLESSSCHEISALPARKPGKLEALVCALLYLLVYIYLKVKEGPQTIYLKGTKHSIMKLQIRLEPGVTSRYTD